MTTSRKTFSLSKPAGDERVPIEALSYFRARNKNNAYHLVIQEFKSSGISQATLARRLGKRPEVVSRLLGAPGNWELDTVSDLLMAISGSEAEYHITRPFEKAPRNNTKPDWVVDSLSTVSEGSPVLRAATKSTSALRAILEPI